MSTISFWTFDGKAFVTGEISPPPFLNPQFMTYLGLWFKVYLTVTKDRAVNKGPYLTQQRTLTLSEFGSERSNVVTLLYKKYFIDEKYKVTL